MEYVSQVLPPIGPYEILAKLGEGVQADPLDQRRRLAAIRRVQRRPVLADRGGPRPDRADHAGAELEGAAMNATVGG